ALNHTFDCVESTCSRKFKMKNFGFHFALRSLILQHHFVAEASQRAERVPLTTSKVLVLGNSK
ncbi:MAG: hypothetical protein IJ253_12175, partial [Bacteroidaceae bacterium]|nr:hypothetical protein [Bacteroidaceae bacterium]